MARDPVTPTCLVTPTGLESRGTCAICRRFMTNQQELAELDGMTIHRACMPRLVEAKKRPSRYD